MKDLIGAQLRGHFTLMGFLTVSLLIFGPILMGLLQLSNYLTTTPHLAFLVLPLAILGLLCLYWMWWFPAKISKYFLAGDRTLLQCLQATCLDWWRCARRLPLVRRLARDRKP